MLKEISTELHEHAPFTAAGALSGIGIVIVLSLTNAPRSLSSTLFWVLHPLHVLLSALVTTSMFLIRDGERGGRRPNWLKLIAIGYVGSVGIATLSDSLIPYVGEWMLGLPNRGVHLGFIEKWWLVNPLAFLGIGLAIMRPSTGLPHAGHVLLSTWASLFHMSLALGDTVTPAIAIAIGVFLFLAVWIPCCASDIVFP
ncbi:hypothetical protein K8I85_04445, partial [bacterium]|nr:hypothetical protein [bacterium]